ncbi:MAG TPA: hypothetical protein VN860_02160 [Candidatus Acidoferrales bacterium]|nr:hypothetical protein [Candidatus Acidoferrales bacterium]
MSPRERLAIFAILGAHLVLTVWLSAVLNIWVDESYTLHTTSLSVAETARHALTWEVQPPLYFVLINLWRHLGGGIFFVRLFSVIAVALGVYIAGLVASAYVSDRYRLWVMAALAFNPFVVGSAVEARVYGLVFLWSALLMWLFYLGYLRPGGTVSSRIGFAIVAAAALFTQYYTGFLLPGCAAILVLQRRWRELGVFVGWMALVGLSFIPAALYVRSEISTNAVNFANPSGFFGNLIHAAQILTLDQLPVDWAGYTARHLVYVVVAILIVIILWRSDKVSLKELAATAGTMLVVAVILFVAAVTLAHMPISSHYLDAFHLPAFIVLFGFVGSLRSIAGQRAIVIAAMALVVTNLLSVANDYRALANYGDWSRVAAFISARESNHQRIVVFDAQSALPLAYYYRGRNPIVPLPHAMQFDRYDLHDVALHSESEVTEALGYTPRASTELWLVTSDACRRVPVNFRCELLDDFVARNYETKLDQHFYGTRVRLLHEKKS